MQEDTPAAKVQSHRTSFDSGAVIPHCPDGHIIIADDRLFDPPIDSISIGQFIHPHSDRCSSGMNIFTIHQLMNYYYAYLHYSRPHVQRLIV